MNSMGALGNLIGKRLVQGQFPNAPEWAFPVLVICSIFNIICAVALLNWKKWGFWGFCGSATIAIIINLRIGIGILPSLLGLVGVPILYGVFQIGKENNGWRQLE